MAGEKALRPAALLVDGSQVSGSCSEWQEGLANRAMCDGLWRSLVSALDWGSRGPGFKSRQPDYKGAGQRGFVVMADRWSHDLAARMAA